jgi:hypothetical protein
MGHNKKGTPFQDIARPKNAAKAFEFLAGGVGCGIREQQAALGRCSADERPGLDRPLQKGEEEPESMPSGSRLACTEGDTYAV